LNTITDGTANPSPGSDQFPLLLSELKIRNHTLKNRIFFAPTCPSWTNGPHLAQFNALAAPYYEERAAGGAGLIIIGSTHVHESSIAGPLALPGLWNDSQIGGFAEVADAVHRHGAKLAVQLRHSGIKATPYLKQDPAYDYDATWYSLAPSQLAHGEFPGGSIAKEMSDAEVSEIVTAHATAARRAIDAGLDGIEIHLGHGYMGWQFLSPLYNKRTDAWGGNYENRLRFCTEVLNQTREAIGDTPFLGFRISSTSLWPGDLEEPDILQIVQDLQSRTDVDFLNVSVGAHHQWIISPMHFQGGWERGYAQRLRQVSTTPVLAVGRITTPEVAEELLRDGVADGVGLARQMIADPDWAVKVAAGQAEDIRRCVAANHCWKSVSRGQRVQCVYNPEVGREARWGRRSARQAAVPKRIVVIGGGPAGLEFTRVAGARGHHVVLLERSQQLGGHVLLHSRLPGRSEYGQIATWLADQAGKVADIRLGVDVGPDELAEICEAENADHVVISTGSRICRDGWQGWTGTALPGADLASCYGWDQIISGTVSPSGHVVVIDDQADHVGPLVAVHLATHGADTVRLVTRWPMVATETTGDSYLEWIMPQVYQHNVGLLVDHFVRQIGPHSVTLYNVYAPDQVTEVPADAVVMVTGRRSADHLSKVARELPVTAEVIGDALSPRGTYEAVYEGHRHARNV
jgi:2,4-dienoyl-CoA reductase-like NADH-dependent reductase (Old Yellow Enzyme family)